MAILGWGAIGIFRQTLSSPALSGLDFNFITTLIFVTWLLVTPRFSFWTRWIIPCIPYCMCLWLSGEAVAHLRLNMIRDESLSTTLYFAAFFGVGLLWLVMIPIEEILYRADLVPRSKLRFWPLGFGVAGIGMVAYAGAMFLPHLRSVSQHANIDELIAARNELVATRNVAVYLSFAFCLLTLARVVLPIRAGNDSRIPASSDS